MLFRSGTRGNAVTAGVALAEPMPTGNLELSAEIGRLRDARHADPASERRLPSTRHRAGLAMIAQQVPEAEHPAPDLGRFASGTGVPEFRREEVSPELLRGAILSRGCLLVRGLVVSCPNRATTSGRTGGWSAIPTGCGSRIHLG